MKKITAQFMPHVRRAPQFVEAVRIASLQAGAGRQGAPAVVQRLDSFQDDPFLLYACLWYAYSEGVPVTFAPAN